ncbi:hypothetical protein C1752_04352 [Acaryochloris thomasi RCC1774]|uniref:Uncharacterized protein n=1 Tax=Acaryochloris thomasi RCC1774 TaxID=1764569 RepID=A0A2W1JM92_9CYAN|nr:hypothetical protein C1752_04352 [Acaryochloris thomasi RCC1774]
MSRLELSKLLNGVDVAPLLKSNTQILGRNLLLECVSLTRE